MSTYSRALFWLQNKSWTRGYNVVGGIFFVLVPRWNSKAPFYYDLLILIAFLIYRTKVFCFKTRLPIISRRCNHQSLGRICNINMLAKNGRSFYGLKKSIFLLTTKKSSPNSSHFCGKNSVRSIQFLHHDTYLLLKLALDVVHPSVSCCSLIYGKWTEFYLDHETEHRDS